ncbi:MAG: hypothetical protein J5966_00555, partial [Lachnospiraceae bacterium]|nr:hypothetical protein [Lachnospiraceae bacterium]
TREEAREAMLEDILRSSSYESLDEIIEGANAGFCGFSADEAWAETESGTGQWKIVKVPEPECYVLTNVSEDTDGAVYAGTATVFDTEFDAIEKAQMNLADDFSISLAEVKYEAQEGGTPYVLSLSKDGRTETYTVSKIPG